jgi:hypothetical protein
MAGPAVAVRNLSAVIDPEALLQKRLVAELRSAVVSVTEAAAQAALRADSRFSLEQLGPERIFVKTSLTPLGGNLELTPSIDDSGRLLLKITSFKAGGFLPLTGLVGGFLNAFKEKIAASHPGIRVVGDSTIEVDLNAALRPHLGDAELVLPPLRSVRVLPGYIEIEF